MKHTHTLFPVLVLVMGLAGPVSGFAESMPASRPAEAKADADAAFAEGEIRRLDLPSGKITLRHGEIRNLDMPPMTMVFTVRDRTRLDQLKVGDRVRFQAINENAQYIVTEIEARQ
jgi:Cu/Ag efflux protein CusF